MSETNTTKSTAAAVAVAEGDDTEILSMYRASQWLSASRGLSVRPQMLYTYGKKGYIATVEADGKRTTVRTIGEWADRYQAKKAEKATKVQEELAGK